MCGWAVGWIVGDLVVGRVGDFVVCDLVLGSRVGLRVELGALVFFTGVGLCVELGALVLVGFCVVLGALVDVAGGGGGG